MGGTLAVGAAAAAITAVAEAIKAINQLDLELIRSGTPEAKLYAKKVIEQRMNLLESGDFLHALFGPLRDLISKIVGELSDDTH